jgi:hypothetical protein
VISRQKYRIRQGDPRILCEIADREATLTVTTIGHRRDVDRLVAGKDRGPARAHARLDAPLHEICTNGCCRRARAAA